MLLREEETKRIVIPLDNATRPLTHKNADDKKTKRLLKEDMYMNFISMLERGEVQLLDDANLIMSLQSLQYEYVQVEGQLTRLRIFGRYTHIAEAIIRALYVAKQEEKSLNLWISYF